MFTFQSRNSKLEQQRVRLLLTCFFHLLPTESLNHEGLEGQCAHTSILKYKNIKMTKKEKYPFERKSVS